LGLGDLRWRASDDQIRQAYKKLVLKYHPDKNAGDPDAAEKFKACSEAYEILSNEEKRSQYDKYGKDAFKDGSGGGGMSAEDIFSQIFEGGLFGGGGRNRGPRKTKDMVVTAKNGLFVKHVRAAVFASIFVNLALV